MHDVVQATVISCADGDSNGKSKVQPLRRHVDYKAQNVLKAKNDSYTVSRYTMCCDRESRIGGKVVSIMLK